MKKTKIRCPKCRRIGAETTKKDSIIELICFRCYEGYTYNNGVYTINEPKDEKQRRHRDKYIESRFGINHQENLNEMRGTYQENLNLKKK